ncbi:MAG: glycosyltransferase N-terminal domain-containing protein [Woeseiaceae bacterium]
MWRYKFLLFLFFIPLTLYTLWQSIRASEFRYFIERVGLRFKTKIKPNGLWFHAASVGEINAIIPLIEKIILSHPNTIITVTSNTITSASVFKKHTTENIQHLYFPLDYKYAIYNIFKKIKPKAIFIVETEFWPNFYTTAHKENIPLTIINGRISEKTLHAKPWLKTIYAKILPLLTQVHARSKLDQSHFIKLGMPHTKVDVLGNIKFYATDNINISPVDLGRKYVLVASTREEEERAIVKAWQEAEQNNHLLVIVPRHPQRRNDILNQLKSFNLNIAVRSKNESISNSTDIYIADTIGELKQFIAGSEFVIMGGSFVKKGGQNILEVAQLGKSTVFGLDMRNFEEEAQLFKKYNAGVQCSLSKLPHYINLFLNDLDFRNIYENNSKTLIGKNDNLSLYYSKIKPYNKC